MRRVINLPLHYGRAPRWLFNRMKLLLKEIVEFIVLKYGEDELLDRISDPFWFQSLGCVVGFDWHSSGLTTILCGALKEGLKSSDVGIFVCGGKGKTSRKTPEEIEKVVDRYSLNLNIEEFVFFSKITAKVDNSLIQDGFCLYHHNFIFNRKGNWAVIQQGMEKSGTFARRYHWFSKDVKDFLIEPHKGIASDRVYNEILLNLIARESKEIQDVIVDIFKTRPITFLKEMKKLEYLRLPDRHQIYIEKDIKKVNLEKIILAGYEKKILNFLDVVKIEGLGPKSMRALSLIAELISGKRASRNDPACFSFAHGGKDGIPYPVDRKVYDTSISILKEAVENLKILKDSEKKKVMRNFNEV